MSYPYHYQCPEYKKVRVIIDSDAKNEADDQFAIVHALLTPKFVVKGLIGAHFGKFHSEHSMQDSYEECRRIKEIMHLDMEVCRGAERAVVSAAQYEYSEGAKLIVREALAEDPRPLYVLFMGPITDMACAFLEHPEIAGRVTAIWNGGGSYPNGGMEFNVSNDVVAANIVMASALDLWQIPEDCVSEIVAGIAELENRVRPCGPIGKYLFEQLSAFNDSPYAHWTSGETWGLGDSCTVGVLLHDNRHDYEMREAPVFAQDLSYIHHTGYRKIRVYKKIDGRMVLEDFFGKLTLASRNAAEDV